MTDPYEVKSLAGEPVQIFDRADFVEFAGLGKAVGQALHMGSQRLAILKALWWHGTIVDRSGFAIGTLTQRAQAIDSRVANVTMALTAPAMAACVERDLRGKRTLAIRLVCLPEEWYNLVERPDASPAVEPAPLPFDAPPIVQAPQVLSLPELPPPGIDGEVAGAVATALLARVVDIINAAGQGSTAPFVAKLESDVRQLERRLGEQTGYVDRLRRDLRETGEELAATKLERDGLRQRLAVAERNLAVAVSPDAQRVIDQEVRRQIDRFMREKPAPGHAAS